MRLSFDTKHFDKGKKEGATAELGAFVPGTQAELFHGGDASFHHEQEFTGASAAEGLVSNAVNHHCRHLGTPDTFRNDQTIDKLSARSSLATAFVADESDESRVAGIAKPRVNSSLGEAMVRTIDLYTCADFVPLICISNSISNTQLNRFTLLAEASQPSL